MTKEEILTYFQDINAAYNECGRYDDLKRMLDELTETKTGKWEYTQYDANQSIGNWHCSECRNIVAIIGERHITPDYKYCPWCGAKMKEEQNEDSN